MCSEKTKGYNLLQQIIESLPTDRTMCINTGMFSLLQFLVYIAYGSIIHCVSHIAV